MTGGTCLHADDPVGHKGHTSCLRMNKTTVFSASETEVIRWWCAKQGCDQTDLHEIVIQPHCLLGVFEGLLKARQHHEGGCSIAIITSILGRSILKWKENSMSHKEDLQIYQRATPGPRHFDRLNENQQTRQQWEVALLTNGLGVAVKSLRVSFLAVENISLFFEAFGLTVEEKPKKKSQARRGTLSRSGRKLV